jgi:alanine racemase
MNKLTKWIEVDKNALLHNLGEFKKIVGHKVTVCPVVKANAYGHGLKEVVSILKNHSGWFAVDSLDEALIVKKAVGKKNIITLGYIPLDRLKEAVDSDISVTIYNIETLEHIAALNSKSRVKVHLKIETGLNRQGLRGSLLLELAKFIQNHDKLFELEGTSTHFANIEDTLDPSYAMKQLEEFKSEIKLLPQRPKIVHCAASAGTLLHKSTHFNMVRVGIGLYGLWPSAETKTALKTKVNTVVVKLSSALTWKSLVAQVKEIKAGESVGYGRTWLAKRNSRIVVIPVGYSDGYDRKLSNTGRVLIHGKSCPVLGRVAMNMIVADVSRLKGVKLEDEVVLLGSQGNESITAEELAEKSGTINYEIVSRINSLIPRITI